jgi:uncharacterized protein with ACT and thioredoxin-like domain
MVFFYIEISGVKLNNKIKKNLNQMQSVMDQKVRKSL